MFWGILLDGKIMNLKISILFSSAILVSCSPYESQEPSRVEIDGTPFKIWKLSGSNSYNVQLDDFWCQKTGCFYKAEYTPKAVKAVEVVSSCKVLKETVSASNRGIVQAAVDCV